MDLRPSSWGRPGPAPARAATVLAADGERISVALDAALGRDDVTFVVSHGFTGGWRRPDNRAVARTLTELGSVVSYDTRGHGRSSGITTIGDDEVLDLDAAIGWARWLGARTVVTVGFSMGGSIVLRQAALVDRGSRLAPDAVVSVSAAGFWFYRGTAPMRLLHRAVETRTGRAVLRSAFGTRVTGIAWEEPYPLSPSEAAALVPPVPLLVVHGDSDHYFPVEHARSIETAAADGAARRGVEDRTTTWVVEGFAHAESGADPELVRRIGAWARDAVLVRETAEERS